jgi:plasmid segregation protein ParM
MSKIIAIDHGNSAVKVSRPGAQAIPAGLAPAYGFSDEIVTYQGKSYALSQRRLPYQRDKSQSDDYFILTLFALARELDGLEESIILATGLPPAHFKTGKANFETYFMSRSPVLYQYNGCPLRVNIEKVLVFPQAYAAAMTRVAEFQSKPRVFVVDVGGMTVDTLLLRHGKPDMAFTLSLEGGVNRLCNDIVNTLSSEMGLRAEQDQVEIALRGEETLFDFAALNLIESFAARFAVHLLADLRERDIDLKTTPSVFIGGGALLLRRYLERSAMVKAPVFVENINANAVGYELLAKAVLRSGHDGTEVRA